jgi:cell division protein FtsI/penicillin-binding protein 2
MKIPNLTRFTILAVILWASGLLIIFQMFQVQNSSSAKVLLTAVSRYENYDETIYPIRGSLYDRYGNLLAGNEQVYQIGVNLEMNYNAEMIASALATAVGADYGSIMDLFNEPLTASLQYLVLTDYVTPDQLTILQQIISDAATAYSSGKTQSNLSALTWTAHLQRSYPEGSLASNIIGFYPYKAGDGAVGAFGIEEKYNDLLAGTPQVAHLSNNPLTPVELPDVEPGASLILTIDRSIQSAMEQIIDNAVADTGSTSGSLVVMDPQTGEILAMASTTRMDLNQYWEFGSVYDNATDFNRPVMNTYEPGSVFKVLTMAAALDAGAVTPETTFLDQGSIEIGGVYITNWDGGAYGTQTMTGCLQHSLNVCLTWVAKQLGPTRFYDYLQAFGIGHLTGVDLSGEAYYPLRLPGDSNWYESDLGTNSFGQGVAVTPIEMIMAISAIANGEGEMMAPHLVKAIIQNGHQYTIYPQIAGTPISAETAQTLTEMLATSLENEASVALVDGYRVAGKTGTAEIATVTGYSSDLTNASFVGWGPVDDPKFLVYIWLEKPETSIWGSVVAAPVFSEAFAKLAFLTNLPPDAVRLQLSSSDQ